MQRRRETTCYAPVDTFLDRQGIRLAEHRREVEFRVDYIDSIRDLVCAPLPKKFFEDRFRHYRDSLGIHNDPCTCTGMYFRRECRQE
jgi:hypothetical protein